MRDFRTKGLILKSRNFGENDKIVTIITPSLGKISAKAFGARKILSQFTGHTEQLSICDFAIYKSTKDLFTITQCKSLKVFKKIKKDLELTNQALEIVELFNLNTGFEENIEGGYDLLKKTLLHLETQKKDTDEIAREYIVELFSILGLLPHKNTSDKEIKEIIRGHVNLPHMSLVTRKTFFTPSILSKILSN